MKGKWNCFRNKEEICGQSDKHISDETVTVEDTGLGKQQEYLLLLATGEEINSQQILNPQRWALCKCPLIRSYLKISNKEYDVQEKKKVNLRKPNPKPRCKDSGTDWGLNNLSAEEKPTILKWQATQEHKFLKGRIRRHNRKASTLMTLM